MPNNLSTVTLQQIVDIAQLEGEIEPVLSVPGASNLTALTAANDVMNAICAQAFPHKWNEIYIPYFYTNSWQQDYAAVYLVGLSGTLSVASVAAPITGGQYKGCAIYTGTFPNAGNNAYANIPFVIAGFTNSGNNGTFLCVASTSTTITLKNSVSVAEAHTATAVSAGGSVMGLSWLERGVAFDVNNSSIPKPWAYVECGRAQSQKTATYLGPGFANMRFTVNWFPNRSLYFGTWGQANVGGTTLGNNPVAGSVYTNPVGATSQPSNPISQIQDANGNYLVITTYGTEGSAAPLAPANATPGTVVSGTGATTAWTVVDPNGWGFRVDPIPSQSGRVWQFSLVGQAIPVRFTNLSQTLAPLPDEFEPQFREGFIAQCYKRSPEAKIAAKFPTKWNLFLQSLVTLRQKQDRELEEYRFIPERTVFSNSYPQNTFQGPYWPFNYPPAR